jgi:small subunit ribosomal protein S9
MPTKTTEKKAEKTMKKEAPKKGKYLYAVGRRKSATAQVRFFGSGEGKITINGRDFREYFTTPAQRQLVLGPLVLLGVEKKVDLEARVRGGGLNGQADAVRLGIARTLVAEDETRKTTLKKESMMTRDARKKERKKPGLKRARRAPQWQKR